MYAVNKHDTGHVGTHGGVEIRTDERTYLRTYVRTVDDVMAIKPRFLASMGYHIFITMVLRARAPWARSELRYKLKWCESPGRKERHCFL